MLGRALMSIFWGIAADRYGRKPVLIIGISSVLVTKLQFSRDLHIHFFYFILNQFTSTVD